MIVVLMGEADGAKTGRCDPDTFESDSICFALSPASMSSRVLSVAT